MKFVDEATIRVQAGNGGHGCLSQHAGRLSFSALVQGANR